MSESTKFCRYCGQEIPVDSEFCEKCGRVLTPKKETATPPQTVANQTPRNARRLFLGVLIIAVVLVAVIAISYVPNPWNHPWVSVDYAYMYTYPSGYNEPVTLGFYLWVSVHNPTHHTYQIGMNDASLEGELQGSESTLSSEKVSLLYMDSEVWTIRSVSTVSYWASYWTTFRSSQLQSCSPALLKLYFLGTVVSSQYTKGTFHLNLTLTINGATVTFTNDFTETFAPITQTTTTTTATTSWTPYKAPDECVLPWV